MQNDRRNVEKKRIDFEKKWLKDLIFESGRITMGDIDIAFSSINHHINDYVKEVKEMQNE